MARTQDFTPFTCTPELQGVFTPAVSRLFEAGEGPSLRFAYTSFWASYASENALSDWLHNFMDIAKTMDLTCMTCIQINNKIVFAIIQSSK